MTSIATREAKAADYDDIAWFYDQHWSNHYHPWAIEVLERTLLRSVPQHAHLLDLCCGNGILAGELCKRGYRITGVDRSIEMLRYAAENAPEAHLVCADARSFVLDRVFDGAMCTFDSLNHILNPADLERVFRNVREALRKGAVFTFDMNLEEAYRTAWNESCSTVDAEHACFIRGGYDAQARLGRTEVTLFRKSGAWERVDLILLQRYYPVDEIRKRLRAAGFESVTFYQADVDLGVEGHFSVGRAVVSAVAP